MEKLIMYINIFIGSAVGVFLGKSIYTYYHFKNNKWIYQMNSAPWYTSIIVGACYLVIVIIIGVFIKYMLKRGVKTIILNEL